MVYSTLQDMSTFHKYKLMIQQTLPTGQKLPFFLSLMQVLPSQMRIQFRCLLKRELERWSLQYTPPVLVCSTASSPSLR